MGPGNPWIVNLCPDLMLTSADNGTLTRKKMVVSWDPDGLAPLPVSVFFRFPDVPGCSDDGYLIHPIEDWASDYFLFTHTPATKAAAFSAVALENNTVLTLYDKSGAPVTTATLGMEDVYYYENQLGRDLTGWRVSAAGGKRLGVVAGAVQAFVPEFPVLAADTIYEQMPPATWPDPGVDSLEYLITPLPTDLSLCTATPWYCVSPAREYVRIMNTTAAPQDISIYQTCDPDDTDLVEQADPRWCEGSYDQVNHILTMPPSAGSWCQIYPHCATVITGGPGNRFQVYQYARGTQAKGIGDPHMVTLVPRQAWSCNSRFVPMPGYDAVDPGRPSLFDGNYVTITAGLNAATVLLDGNPVTTGWEVFPGFDFMWTSILLDWPGAPLEHWVKAYDSGGLQIPVGVMVHGYNNFYGSYAYRGKPQPNLNSAPPRRSRRADADGPIACRCPLPPEGPEPWT